jgi:hypothetical protein
MICREKGAKTVGRGCLFWLLVSVVLSVTLTVLANVVLFALSG